MADVQVEHGYSRIANEILEHIAKLKINGTQFRILMVIWRYTYGFHRKEHELSLTFIAEATELNRDQIKREINALIDSFVVNVVKEATFSTTRVIAFNKNYEEWEIAPSVQKSTQWAKKPTGSEIDYSPGGELAPTGGGGLAPQEIYSFKDIFKEIAITIEDQDLAYQNLEHEFCALHGIGSWTLNQKSVQAIQKIVKEVPVQFAIDTMRNIYQEKKRKGEEVNSFTYYYPIIKQSWMARTAEPVKLPDVNVAYLPSNRGNRQGRSGRQAIPLAGNGNSRKLSDEEMEAIIQMGQSWDKPQSM